MTGNVSKSMASGCVRNTMLEDIHAGIEPVTQTGDYSDVLLTYAVGCRRLCPPQLVLHFFAHNELPLHDETRGGVDADPA